MSTSYTSFDHLPDQDLLREVTRLAAREREAVACLVASLAALDRRRLYLAEGYGSLFVYCTQVLRLSESAADKRITAARAAQRFPVILERLAAGDVALTTVRLLASHLQFDLVDTASWRCAETDGSSQASSSAEVEPDLCPGGERLVVNDQARAWGIRNVCQPVFDRVPVRDEDFTGQRIVLRPTHGRADRSSIRE